jgi:surface antigen
MKKICVLATVITSLVVVLAGCGSPQGSRVPAKPTRTESASPKPSSTPLAVLESSPSAISGSYTLYRRLTSCAQSLTCSLNPMKIRITCSGVGCTIVRTNASSNGLPPWDHPIPLTFGNGVWHASGTEKYAAECHNVAVPGTGVSLVLKVVSGGVSNGTWRARQLAGSFTVMNVATACSNAGLTVETVDSAPDLTLGTWPGVDGPVAASKYYGYPFPNASACTDGGACDADYWNFYQGQCTSWVAYRLHELNGITISGGSANWSGAGNWYQYAKDHGISVTTSPAVGSIAWWPNSNAHKGGHVAYVEQVNSPTSIVISEMNYDNDNGFRVRTITAASPDWPTYFIHIADM